MTRVHGLRTRVLQVIPDLGVGGAERMVANLAISLTCQQYEVRVVSLYGAGHTSIEQDLRNAGIETAFLGKRLGFDPLMFHRLRSELATFSPAVVHTHRASLQYALPALAVSRRSVGVHTVHTLAHIELPKLGRFAHRIAFKMGVHPVAIGDAMVASFQDVYGIDPSAVIPNGVPTAVFRTPSVSRGDWRRREGLGDSDTVFVCAARLSPPKNLPLLLRAFAKVVAAVPAARLVLAGDGPLRHELERTAEDLRLGGRALFLGARSDIAEVLGAADAFVLCSEWEGSPLSVMEAMAAGLPVLATRVGGIPQIVDAPRSGLLVQSGDEEGLFHAMIRLADDRELRRSLGRAASQRARQEFDVSTMASRYASLYQRLLAART